VGGADDDDDKIIQHLKEKEYLRYGVYGDVWENRNHDVVHWELEPNVLPCGLQDLRVLLQAL